MLGLTKKVPVLFLFDDLIRVKEMVIHVSPPCVLGGVFLSPVYLRKLCLSSDKGWICHTQKGPLSGRPLSTLSVIDFYDKCCT
jgi:hypothetical protein